MAEDRDRKTKFSLDTDWNFIGFPNRNLYGKIPQEKEKICSAQKSPH